MAIENFKSAWMNEEHRALLDSATHFFEKEWVEKDEQWRKNGAMDVAAWHEAGQMGLLCASIPEEYGGIGGDFGHEAAINLAQGYANLTGFGNAIHSGIVAHYVLNHGTEEQKHRWLPKLTTGELIGSLAMTEPGTGSDVQNIRTHAVKDGEHYILNGSKTFITNGQLSNFVVVACKTDKNAGSKGVSLLCLETQSKNKTQDENGDLVQGFTRGRNLEKMGLSSQDTSELFFDNVKVPAANLLGSTEGKGFAQMMTELPQERLLVAIGSVAAMEHAVKITTEYTKERKAFGKPIFDFQNTRFKLAECRANALAARAMLDSAISDHMQGELSVQQAALVKYWITDVQAKVIDECLQLFGGYGYMKEYPIARMYTDARVQRIYAGTNEIMKELAARSL